MKDLLKQYVSKGYEPTFLVIVTELNGKEYLNDFIPTDDDDFHRSVSKVSEKLELYLMRDWLEENRGYSIDSDYCKYTETIETRIEALKSALEEAIKHIKHI